MPALEKDEIESLFKSLDIDKDGRVSVSELSAVLKGKRNQRASTTTDAKRIIDEHSHGSQHTLSFAEFVKYIHDTETQLKLAFKQLDRNSDNKVDVEEVLLAMKDLGVNISRCDAEQLLKKMDKDGSLTINFEEWRDFLLFSGTSDIKTIFQYWRHASATDIGEIYSIPDDYTEEEKRSGEAWKTLLAGGLAGCISRTATAPLDRIKVIWQALGGKAVQSGVLGSLRKMLNEGGFTSLWRGNGINCIKIAPETALKFQTYEAIKKLICANRVSGGHLYEFTLSEKFVAGALAGAFSQSIIYPMEVLKTRMCLRKTGQYSSIWDCAGQLYRTHGWRVFYRGYVPNLLGILPYAGVDMALYETFKHLATNWNQPLSVKAESVGRTGDSGSTKLPLVPPVVISLCSGALSSVCGQVATYPLALVKTKLQAQSSITENVEKTGLIGLVKNIIKREGLAGLYAGIGPNMLKVIPAVSISYASYEMLREQLGIKKK